PSGRTSDSTTSRDASGDRAAAEPERAVPDDEIVLRPDLNRTQQPSDASDSTAAPQASTEPPSQPDIEPESQPESQRESQPQPATATPDGDQATDEAGTGDWVVQVASFGSRESSDQVRERLEALGHNVTRDEIVRGQSLLHRLRTGPYPDRAAAQQALEQIAATVAGVEPIVRRVDEQLRQGTQAGFAVQVGSFVSEDNAQGETRRLDELGFEAFRFSEQVGERLIWRVMVGPVAERDAADELRSRLAERAGLEGLVVSYP
ncbi:MAG: SPOR domain-containing protein, partial [Wenzhouxiangellaceae bacterium]